MYASDPMKYTLAYAVCTPSTASNAPGLTFITKRDIEMERGEVGEGEWGRGGGSDTPAKVNRQGETDR